MSVACNDPTSGLKLAEFVIGFHNATKFEFQDPREAPNELRESMQANFDYVVQFELSSTTQCVVYVRRA
jgi:hypothetical protein